MREPSTVLSVRVLKRHLDLLDDLAGRFKTTRSALIQRAIRAHINTLQHVPFTDEEMAELEDDENWDWEHPVEAALPSGPVGIRYSVRFSAEEFHTVCEVAAILKKPVGDFIRWSALSQRLIPKEET